MKSYFLLLSVAACCFGAMDGTVGEPQHQIKDRKHAISAKLGVGPAGRVVSKPVMRASETGCPHRGAKLCDDCGKAIA